VIDRLTKCLSVGAAAILASGLAVQSASAQGVGQTDPNYGYLGRGEGVKDRQRPAYDAIGFDMGGFRLFPAFTLGVGFDDNVTAAPSSELDSVTISPIGELELVSEWSRHFLGLQLVTDNIYYKNDGLEEEDKNDFLVSGTGRLDVSSRTRLDGNLSYGILTEDRGSANTPGAAAEPVDFNRFDASVGIGHRFNRLGVGAGFRFTDFDYDNVSLIGGGTGNQDQRDRKVLQYRAEAGYEFSPGYEAIVRGTYNTREYDTQFMGVNRDSDGYEFGAGMRFELTKLIAGEVFAGYLEQDYDALADIDGVSYGIDLEWYITQLTTISVYGKREVEETTGAVSSGYLVTRAGANVDHELLRNLILSAGFGWENNDYEGSARDDDILTGSIGAEYLMNRNIHLGFGYTYKERDSNITTLDYDRNRVGASLRFQM
jgi:hypothetical protein